MKDKQMSMIEIAEHLISKRKGPVTFEKLVQDVATLKGVTPEEFKQNIGVFYTDLIASGRFVMVEGKWDLKERQLYAAGEYEFSIEGYEGIYEGESDDSEKDAYDLDLQSQDEEIEQVDEEVVEFKDEIDEVVQEEAKDEEEVDNNDGDISESETSSKYDETEKYNEYDDDSFYE